MIKDIVTNRIFLSQKASDATVVDLNVVQDLLDTMMSRSEDCLGMAANMIGVNKRIIVFIDDDQKIKAMLNPEIIKTFGNTYNAVEGCLSYESENGTSTKRYHKIKVRYNDTNFKTKIRTYSGITAQIIQHEIDHCNGVLV